MDYRRRVLTWLSLATAAGMARSAPNPPQLRSLKAVTISVAPYGMRSADGGAGGLFSELLAALAQRSGIAIDNVVVPYPRAMAMMATGEADTLISIANSRLVPIARPLVRIFEGEMVVVGRAGTRYTSVADLRGKIVGHIRSAEYNVQLETDPLIRKYETTSIDQTLRMLLGGRVDAAVGSRESMLYTLRGMGLPREKLGPMLTIGRSVIHLYLSHRVKDPAVAEALIRAMDAMRDSGMVGELRKRYFAGLQVNDPP